MQVIFMYYTDLMKQKQKVGAIDTFFYYSGSNFFF